MNANGYCLDSAGTRFDAVLTDGPQIVAVGAAADIRLQFGRRITEQFSVDGATVIPGLVDAHLHLAGVGQRLLTLDLTGCTSKTDLLNRITFWQQQLAEGDWIIGAGWDENRFQPALIPTLAELDAVSGGRPLLLTRICSHAYLANTEAFLRAGLGPHPGNPSDGHYGYDENGGLSGVVYENAVKPLLLALPKDTVETYQKWLKLGVEQALAAGLTAVHSDDTRYCGGFVNTWETYTALLEHHGLRLRVHQLVDYSLMDECLASLPSLRQSDEWLSRGVAKLFADGAMGARTAWLREPYSDLADWSGTAMHFPEELAQRVREAHIKGFGVGVHAIGDAGLAATLEAIEGAPAVAQRDRVIHAELVAPDLIERMVKLGKRVVLDVQPRFTVSDFPWVAQRVGAARVPFVCAWRTLLEAGLTLAGSSDAPIEPIQPLLGIHAAVTRRLPYGSSSGYEMAQVLPPVEAVAMFTREACYANHSEGYKGVIQPGYVADFTVIDRDIVNPRHVDEIRDAQVLYTIIGGEVAYSQQGGIGLSERQLPKMRGVGQ